MILITSPELAEFRKRLKSLETRVGSEVSFDVFTDGAYTARWSGVVHHALQVVVS